MRRRCVRGDRGVLKRCHALLQELDVAGVIPSPFNLAQFTDRLARHRHRDIRLVPVSVRREAPCGLWVSAGVTDYVFYAGRISPLHQCHVVLHELGHLAFGHQDGGLPVEELARVLAPSLDPILISRVLGRSADAGPAENEAETFADLVLAWFWRHGSSPRGPTTFRQIPTSPPTSPMS